MDPAIIGVWIEDGDFSFGIVIFYEDGKYVSIRKGIPSAGVLGIHEYEYYASNNLYQQSYTDVVYEIKVIDGVETLFIGDRVFKRLK